MPASDLEVGGVVSRSDLYGTGAKGGIHSLVGYDGDETIHDRKTYLTTDESSVPLISRMHGYGGIPEHGLGTSSGDDHNPAAVGQRIAKVPQLAIDLILLHFLIGERGQAPGAPVDDVVAAIYELLLVESHKHLPYCTGETL